MACKNPLPVPGLPVQCAATPPVAQLDRALPSGGKGQGFKSLRAGHLFLKPRYALHNGVFIYGKVVVANHIAIHRKPHTVLRRFAVQPRTVFSGAPCLKLSVDGHSFEKRTGKTTAWTAILWTLPAHECQASCGDRDEFSITAQKKSRIRRDFL